MEAMAAGLPVLSTCHSGIPELIEHGESGLPAAEKNRHALARSIVPTPGAADRRCSLAASPRREGVRVAHERPIMPALVGACHNALDHAERDRRAKTGEPYHASPPP